MLLNEIITKGSGDCLFHSVACCLKLHGIKAKQEDLRKLACENLNSSSCKAFLDGGISEAYIENMRKAGTFGSLLELELLSTLLHIDFTVFVVESNVSNNWVYTTSHLKSKLKRKVSYILWKSLHFSTLMNTDHEDSVMRATNLLFSGAFLKVSSSNFVYYDSASSLKLLGIEKGKLNLMLISI